MARNQVRIISGLWKGRKLNFPARAALRPTPSRVRGTLFNWLAADIGHSNCLDLFAGSGALGFEALSRGANAVALVDNDRRAVRALRTNGAWLGTERLLIRQQAALTFLKCSAGQGLLVGGRRILRWDCVFLDPPFAAGLLQQTLALLDEQILRPNGLVYFETQRDATLDLTDWTVVRESAAGNSRFGLLQRRGNG